MVAKVIACGFVGHPHAYLRDSYCVLDFAVVTLAWVSFVVPGAGRPRVLPRVFAPRGLCVHPLYTPPLRRIGTRVGCNATCMHSTERYSLPYSLRVALRACLAATLPQGISPGCARSVRCGRCAPSSMSRGCGPS